MTFVTNNNQETVLSGTWDNSAVAYTRLRLNVNDVSSASTSNLLDLQNNGVSQFKVEKNGGITFQGDNGLKAPGNIRIWSTGSASVIIRNSLNTQNRFNFDTFGGVFTMSNENNQSVVLRTDTTNILAQRYGTDAQTFRLYNSYTNSTTYERASLGWTANEFKIQTETESQSARNLVLGTSSIPRITITSTGNQTYNASNTAGTFDIHTLGNYSIHNYAPGYVTNSSQNIITSSIRMVGYQGTNQTIKPILEVKDYRNTHWNNLGSNNRSAGIGFLFENGNSAGTPIAEKYTAGIYAISEGGDRFPSTGLAFAANGLTEMMRLSNAGNLGIGTNAPTQRLHVSGNAIITSSLTLNPNPALIGTTNDILTIYRNGSGGDKAAIVFKRDGGQTVAKIICGGAANAGAIFLDPYINYAPAYSTQHAFSFYALAATGISFAADFGLINGTAHGKLNIWNSSYSGETEGINLGNASNGINSNISISWRTYQNLVRAKIVGEAVTAGATSGGALNFYTTNNDTGSASRMYLDSSGNVGIGTTTPTTRLHVSGNTTINGNVVLGSGNTIKAPEASIIFGSTNSGAAGFGMFGNQPVLTHTGSYGFVQLSRNSKQALLRTEDNATLSFLSYVNPANFRIYNNYADDTVTSYERASLGWTSNAFIIRTEASGAGSNRNLQIETSGQARIIITPSGVSGIVFQDGSVQTTGGSQNLNVTEYESAANYYYYGGTFSSGAWQINRYDKNNVTIKVKANVSNNPSATDLSTAWTNRVTLNYT